VLNVTPDSFSDGGEWFDREAAIAHGRELVAQGADLVDVGGESTRPGSDPVPAEVELIRVIPVIERLVAVGVAVSVDTMKSEVAAAALNAGARMVNDVTALRHDPRMAEVVAAHGAALCLMHMKGEPKTMQDDPSYCDVVAEVRGFLGDRVEAAVGAGIDLERLCIDPGIGFGKTLEHNLTILRDIRAFHHLGVPVLVGPSRKQFIGTLTDTDVDDRIEGTAGVVAWCAAEGVDIIRVHDVKEMTRVVRVVDAIARPAG
jgi:dihydropteroate synthase